MHIPDNNLGSQKYVMSNTFVWKCRARRKGGQKGLDIDADGRQ